MAKKIELLVENDPFRKLTFTQTSELKRSIGDNNQNFSFQVDHISTTDGDFLRIKLQYWASSWAFLNHGSLILLINRSESIEIKATPAATNASEVYSGGVYECIFYVIDKNILEKICEAETLDIKLIGTQRQIEMPFNDFIAYDQFFYNKFYDDTKYIDTVEEVQEEPQKEFPKEPKTEKREQDYNWWKGGAIIFAVFYFLLKSCS